MPATPTLVECACPQRRTITSPCLLPRLTRAACHLPPAEEKKLKLRSPNFVVSDTRLSVRNVPPSWTEKQLKAAFIQAVRGARGAASNECDGCC